MKKIFLIISVSLLALSSYAQNTWEKPVDNDDDKPKRGLFDRNKTKTIDKKYLEGGVPEINGKVNWTKTFKAPGKSASQIYNTLLAHFQNFVKGEEQLPASQVAVVNKATSQIGVRAQEWLVFENRLLSLDRTKMNYTIIANCADGKVEIQITNISYKYEEDQPTRLVVTAEDWITDKETLNKKKTGFIKGGVKKFRMHTIDRVEEVLNGIEAALK